MLNKIIIKYILILAWLSVLGSAKVETGSIIQMDTSITNLIDKVLLSFKDNFKVTACISATLPTLPGSLRKCSAVCRAR